MKDFLIKELFTTNIENEILNIGFDNSYISKAKEKFCHKNFKFYNLDCAQNNIIKQIALSVGADCATNKYVITSQIDKSDCIIGGSVSQLKIIAKKLQLQPFGLKDLGILLEKQLLIDNKNNKTKIMGILNVTKNSFSDGGDFYEYEDSIRHLNELIEGGADIIDIGAESTKPYSQSVSDDEQLEKLCPILEYVKNNNIKTPISIDTRSSGVAKECIDYGISIINDVSGFDYDKKMVDIIAQNPDIKIILQHSKGTPENMQNNPQYENLMDEIFKNLKNKTDYAISNGIKPENIIIDPGIGFGKTKEHNFEILNRWQELKSLGYPILIGLSRKSLLGCQNKTNQEKDIYTLALNSLLISQNVDYIRVHNVKLHKDFQNIVNNS